MSHEIGSRDKVMLVKNPAWHGLGMVLPNAPTRDEAIKMLEIGWEVETAPLFAMVDGKPVQVKAACIRRKDTGEILGHHVGPRYHPLQNADAFKWFDPFLESGLATLETGGTLFNGKRVWILAKLNRANSEITPGDEVLKYILLSHSHDGLLAVRGGYTPTRVVCNNTLQMALGENGKKKPAMFRLLHTKSLKIGLDAAQDAISRADADFEDTAKVFRKLAKKGLTGTQFREYVRETLKIGGDKADADLGKKSEETLSKLIANLEENKSISSELLANFKAREQATKQADEIVGAAVLEEVLTGNLEAGKGQAVTQGKKGPTWWHAYNAITEFLTHQKGKNSEIRLDQNWWGESATLNRNALHNAMVGAGIA